MKTNKKPVTFIHINAQSEIYSVMEIVPENKAVKRLEDIRDGFISHSKKFGGLEPKLVVKTCVHNPELPLR